MNKQRIMAVAVAALVVGPLLTAQTAFAEFRADPALRFEQAQKLRKNRELDTALSELDDLIKDFPYDVDYALARAQILAELQRDDEALDELSVATDLAPDYEDVWRLRFKLLGRQKDEQAARKRAALQQEAAKRFPDADWWDAPAPVAASRWMLLVGAGHDNLSNDLPGWNDQFVELQLEHDPDTRYHFRLGRNERYSAADTSLGLGTERSWQPGWIAGIEVAATENPDYQPRLGYSGHVGKSLADGWVVDLRYRRREYTSVTVGSTIGTVEKYYGDYRFAYSLGWSRLHGAANFANHVLTANWFYDDVSSLGLTLNTGKEAESIGNGQVLKTDVRGFSLSGRRKLSDRFGIHWWLGVHDQGDYYRRKFLGMAVSIRI